MSMCVCKYVRMCAYACVHVALYAFGAYIPRAWNAQAVYRQGEEFDDRGSGLLFPTRPRGFSLASVSDKAKRLLSSPQFSHQIWVSPSFLPTRNRLITTRQGNGSVKLNTHLIYCQGYKHGTISPVPHTSRCDVSLVTGTT